MKESGPPCKHCGEPLRRNNTSGYHTKKRECQSAYVREWRKANPEKNSASDKRNAARRKGKTYVPTFEVAPNRGLWYDGDEHEPLTTAEFRTQYEAGRREFIRHDVPETFRDDPAIRYTGGRRVRAYLPALEPRLRAQRGADGARHPRGTPPVPAGHSREAVLPRAALRHAGQGV